MNELSNEYAYASRIFSLVALQNKQRGKYVMLYIHNPINVLFVIVHVYVCNLLNLKVR